MAGKQKDGFQEPKTHSDGMTLRKTTTQNWKMVQVFKKISGFFFFFNFKKGRVSPQRLHHTGTSPSTHLP